MEDVRDRGVGNGSAMLGIGDEGVRWAAEGARLGVVGSDVVREGTGEGRSCVDFLPRSLGNLPELVVMLD